MGESGFAIAGIPAVRFSTLPRANGTLLSAACETVNSTGCRQCVNTARGGSKTGVLLAGRRPACGAGRMASAMAGLRLFRVRYLDVRPPRGRTALPAHSTVPAGAGLPRFSATDVSGTGPPASVLAKGHCAEIDGEIQPARDLRQAAAGKGATNEHSHSARRPTPG